MEFKILEGGKTESQSNKWDCPSDEAAKPEAPCHDPPYPKATSADRRGFRRGRSRRAPPPLKKKKREREREREREERGERKQGGNDTFNKRKNVC